MTIAAVAILMDSVVLAMTVAMVCGGSGGCCNGGVMVVTARWLR